MATRRGQARRDAASVIRNILAALKLPATVATYLRGYADGLEENAPSDVDR